MQTTTARATTTTLPTLLSPKTMPAAELVAAIESTFRAARRFAAEAERSEGVARLDAECAALAERRRLAAYLRAAKARRIQFRIVG